MTLAELNVKVTADLAEVKTELGELKKNLKTTDTHASNFSSNFKKAIAGISVAAIVYGIKRLSGEMIKLASDAEETRNKFNVVFSGIRDQADAAAKNLNKNFGLSKQASEDLLSGVGDLLTGFGLSQQEALKLSDAAAQLGTDLASFTNYAGGAKGATEALAAAMLGERERVKMLGIAITETDLQKFAADQGKAWDQMTRGQKAALTLEMAIKQSKNAIGDFNRSQYSFANQMRIAEANIIDVKTSLGNALLPIVTLGVRSFNEFSVSLKNIADRVTNFVKSAEGAAKIGELFGVIAGTLAGLKVILEPIGSALKKSFGYVSELFNSLGTNGLTVSYIFEKFAQTMVVLGAAIQIGTRILVGFISNLIDLGKIGYNTAILMGDLWKAIKGEGFQDAKKNFNEIIELSKKIGNETKDVFVDVSNTIVNTAKSFTSETDRLAKTAEESYAASRERVKQSIIATLTATQTTITAANNAEIADKQRQREELLKIENEYKAKLFGDKSNEIAMSYEQEKVALDELKNLNLLSDTEKEIAKTNIHKYYEDIRKEYTRQKAIESAQAVLGTISNLNGQLSALYSMYYSNQTAQVDNDKFVKQTALDETYQKQKESIEKNYKDEEERSAKLKILDEQYARDKKTLDDKTEKEKRKLQRDAAIKSKELAIFETLIAIPQAAYQAYKSLAGIPYVGPILGAAAAVAATALGVAKLAIIKQQPIPKAATGGVFDRPYIGGEAGMEMAVPLESTNGQKAIRSFASGLLDEMSASVDTRATTERVQGGAGQGGGNVYLDGSLVGKWLTRGSDNGAFRLNKMVVV